MRPGRLSVWTLPAEGAAGYTSLRLPLVGLPLGLPFLLPWLELLVGEGTRPAAIGRERRRRVPAPALPARRGRRSRPWPIATTSNARPPRRTLGELRTMPQMTAPKPLAAQNAESQAWPISRASPLSSAPIVSTISNRAEVDEPERADEAGRGRGPRLDLADPSTSNRAPRRHSRRLPPGSCRDRRPPRRSHREEPRRPACARSPGRGTRMRPAAAARIGESRRGPASTRVAMYASATAIADQTATRVGPSKALASPMLPSAIPPRSAANRFRGGPRSESRRRQARDGRSEAEDPTVRRRPPNRRR